MTSLLNADQCKAKSQKTRAFHRGAQLTLEARPGAGDARRDQFAVLGDEFLDDVHILVIHLGDLLDCKAAELAALEQIVAGRTFVLVIFLFVWTCHDVSLFQNYVVYMQNQLPAADTLLS